MRYRGHAGWSLCRFRCQVMIGRKRRKRKYEMKKRVREKRDVKEKRVGETKEEKQKKLGNSHLSLGNVASDSGKAE